MGFRDRWRAIPLGERVEIALTVLCVAVAYVTLVRYDGGWRVWLPQAAAVLLCLRLAWRRLRH
ncbi:MULTISPECIES: hypothetical protein [unclassified Nocardioides]|uniref:hypothetical protein n=1 Tax=unclassified Nocardioides TaxID=2615069 RepID=UPI003014F3A1